MDMTISCLVTLMSGSKTDKFIINYDQDNTIEGDMSFGNIKTISI